MPPLHVEEEGRMFIFSRKLWKSALTPSRLAVTALVSASLYATAAHSDPSYPLTFTDTHGDVGDLVLQTASPISPAGTLVTGLTGTFNGFSATLLPIGGFAGNNNLIYSTPPLFDYKGLSFDANGADYNLYSPGSPISPPYHPASSNTPLAVCYVGSCSATTGFYLFTTLNGKPVPGVPEPGTIAVLGVALAGLASVRRRRGLANGQAGRRRPQGCFP
jgi:hypothetical protein